MRISSSLLFSLFLLQPVASEIYLSIVTLVDENGLSPSQVESVSSTMTADKLSLNDQVVAVATSYESMFAPGTWEYSESPRDINLRGRQLQGCDPCNGFPAELKCYWNGRWKPDCRRERDLQAYRALDETALSKLNEKDRHRHLQMADMCDDAAADVSAKIKADIASGKITAPLTSFSLQCLCVIE